MSDEDLESTIRRIVREELARQSSRSPYQNYLDDKLIQRDRNLERSKREDRVPCSNCGAPSDVPCGASYIGRIRCRSCQRDRMRIRG